MARRVYLAKVQDFDSRLHFRPGMNGPAWYNALFADAISGVDYGSLTDTQKEEIPETVKDTVRDITVGQVIDYQDPKRFVIGVLNTNASQHSVLQAASSVRFVSSNIMDTEYSNMTNGQRAAVQEIGTFLGVNLTQLTGRNMLHIITGESVLGALDGLNGI